MKKTITMLLLLTTCIGFSQITYQPGYFITNNGIKTECLIKNVAWKDNPTGFDYKTTEAGDLQKGYLSSVAKFSVAGYTFVRFDLEIDRSASDLGTMSSQKEPQYTKETLYLKTLVEGKANLYQYEDRNLVKFFYSTGNHTTARQLIYKQYGVNGSVAYNNSFRGQLYEIMKPEINDVNRFKNLKYDKDALIKLFIEYDGTNGEKGKDVTASHNRTSFNIKITPGVNFASLSAAQTEEELVTTIDFDSKPVFTIGAELEMVLPVNNGKWSVFANPNYQSYNNDGLVISKYGNQQWKADYKFLEIPLGLRHYMYLSKKSRLFLNLAYVVAVNLGDSKIYLDHKSSFGDYALSAAISKSSNFAAGAGFSYGRYSIEVRYSFKRNLLSDYITWHADYKSIGIIAGYTIF